VRWSELDDERFVDFAEGTSVAGIVNRTSTRLGMHRQVVNQVTQVDLQLGLVRNGLGVAVVRHRLAVSTPGLAVAR
jgi:DNA-binding transcriptional LysR family regulator